MTVDPIVRHRFAPARRRQQTEPLHGALPLRGKKLALARTIRGTILPQTIWLCGDGDRLGFTAAHRRLYRIEFRADGAPGRTVDLFGFQDADDRVRTGEILHELVDEYLRQDQDLTRSFETVAEEFPPEDGLSAYVLIRPEHHRRPPLVLHPAPETDDAAQTVPQPAAAPAAAPAAPAKPQRARPARPPQRPAAPDAPTPQEALAVALTRRLGPRLILIWLPADGDATAVAIRTNGETREVEEFPPRALATQLRRRQTG